MPIILVTGLDTEYNEEAIDEVEKITRKVFDLTDGILPLPPGTIQIIPNFKECVSADEPLLLISIFLYEKEDRTLALLQEITRGFLEGITKVFEGVTVIINDQPEELWRTI